MHKHQLVAAISFLALAAPACGSGDTDTARDTAATETVETTAAEQKVVTFATSDLDLEGSVQDSTVALVGTVERTSVEPFGEKIEGTMAVGRRIAWVKVDDVRKGDVADDSTIAVWYGTELAEGVTSEGDANITVAPKGGQEVFVLASLVSTESKEIAALGYPLYVASEGSGIGIIEDGKVATRTDAMPIERLDELVGT